MSGSASRSLLSLTCPFLHEPGYCPCITLQFFANQEVSQAVGNKPPVAQASQAVLLAPDLGTLSFLIQMSGMEYSG